ncbi:hypothetical protein ANCDUO_27380 [Ancylostoma duodenale]|uniref:Uncharacterized protein n=1 Tax=Ancylostoma duodenale TaxID=51022 RepID=A0A0C2BFV2_9BILA|nr:hypothetical protein ANCDUO_27380 [Ancylostoma duodenale]
MRNFSSGGTTGSLNHISYMMLPNHSEFIDGVAFGCSLGKNTF